MIQNKLIIMKNRLIIIGVFIILLVTCMADTNDLSFEIHFDPTKTKTESGTNYYGIDYLLINNGTRPLGIGQGKINIYAIDSSGRRNQIFPAKDNMPRLESFKYPSLLQKGESWKGVAWIPAIDFANAKSEDKFVAEKNLCYITNYQSNEYLLFFIACTTAIPVGYNYPFNTNPATNK